MRLNQEAKRVLEAAGVSQAAWTREWSNDGTTWGGDACGCPDDRCIGYHHSPEDACGCLRVLLNEIVPVESPLSATTRTVLMHQQDRVLILTACTAAMKAANNHADPFGAEARACALESLQLSREWRAELDADLAVTS